jgi:dTDP-4-dehydrorhamnose 3,5-epimerase-like enzyme
MDSIKLIKLPSHVESNGELLAIEGNTKICPFDIARIFTVKANMGDIRGQHAHIHCVQLLICLTGIIEVRCHDGIDTEVFLLDSCTKGLLINPGVWAEQEYLQDGAILNVLCSHEYDNNDYIRNYNEFISYKYSKRQSN